MSVIIIIAFIHHCIHMRMRVLGRAPHFQTGGLTDRQKSIQIQRKSLQSRYTYIGKLCINRQQPKPPDHMDIDTSQQYASYLELVRYVMVTATNMLGKNTYTNTRMLINYLHIV